MDVGAGVGVSLAVAVGGCVIVGGEGGRGKFVCVCGVEVGTSMWVSSSLGNVHATNPCRVFTNQFLGSKKPRMHSLG